MRFVTENKKVPDKKVVAEKKISEARPVATKKADNVTWAALRKFVYASLEKSGYKRTDIPAQAALITAEFTVKGLQNLIPEDIMFFCGGSIRAGLVQSYFYKTVCESLKESTNLPAIAQAAGLAVNPKITSVVRQDTIYSTIQAMGLLVKINAMRNVVAEVPDMPTAGAVLQTIYQQFGVKGSFMVTWEGKGKLYFDPKTPVDKSVALAYAKQAKLPPPNFTRLLNSLPKEKEDLLKEAVSSFKGKNMWQIILKWISLAERESLISILEKEGFYEGWDYVEKHLIKDKKVPVDVSRAFIAYSFIKLGFA